MRFLHANRDPPTDQVRGHASLETALTGGCNSADASRVAGQIPNECLICLSIDMAASVYRPWVRYWSSCDAPSSITAAITKPLNIVGLSKGRRPPTGLVGLKPFGIRCRRSRPIRNGGMLAPIGSQIAKLCCDGVAQGFASVRNVPGYSRHFRPKTLLPIDTSLKRKA
jgi:hypothetical protein